MRLSQVLAGAVLVLGMGRAGFAAELIRVNQRVALPTLVVVPAGLSGAISISEIIAAMAEAYEAHTLLEVRSAERWGVDLEAVAACPSDLRFICWFRLLRTASGPGPSVPRLLQVVTVHKGEEGAPLLQPILVDYGEDITAERRDVGALEAAVLKRLVVGTPLLHRAGEAPRFTDFVSKQAAETLRESGFLSRPGSISLSLRPGSSVHLDAVSLGASSASELLLEGVLPGVHEIRVRSPEGGGEFRTHAFVRAARTTPMLIASRGGRRTTVIGLAGAVGLASGAALVAIDAVGRSPGSPGLVDPAAAIAPATGSLTSVGVGLAVLGAAWIGGWLLDEGGAHDAWVLATGTALGGLAGGTTEWIR